MSSPPRSGSAGLDHRNLPSISRARLPANYEAAKQALAACERIEGAVILNAVERARHGVREVLAAYRDATTTDQREDIARLAALLTPQGGLSLAELGEQALQLAREG